MTKDDRPAGPRIVAACFVAMTVLAGASGRAAAQPVGQDERVAAAVVLALGRAPTAAETKRWLAQGALSIAELVERQRRALREDAASERAVSLKAARDAIGNETAGGRSPAGAARTYADLVQAHLEWLAGHLADYELVVQRAYRAILSRDPYPIEVDYWKRRPVTTFALLGGCVESWAVRNQPGLMATTGVASVSVNSRYLVTVRLSPSVAAEARAAIGLPPVDGRTPASSLGRHVVAPGATGIASVGGVHFVAAGGPVLADALTAR